MTIRAVLWRVLLCISVILNGSALASTSMPMTAPAHQQPVGHIAAGTISPSHPACHEEAASAGMPASHHGMPSSPAPGKGRHGAPDCCPAGTCACVWIPSLPGVAIAPFDAVAVQGMRSGQARVRHDEPALPHLIRPPIG